MMHANNWNADAEAPKFLHGKLVAADDDDDDIDPRWRVTRRGGKLVNATYTCEAFASDSISSCKVLSSQLKSAAKEVGRIIIIIIITTTTTTFTISAFVMVIITADQEISS
jgi:hypothetical protein